MFISVALAAVALSASPPGITPRSHAQVYHVLAIREPRPPGRTARDRPLRLVLTFEICVFGAGLVGIKLRPGTASQKKRDEEARAFHIRGPPRL